MSGIAMIAILIIAAVVFNIAFLVWGYFAFGRQSKEDRDQNKSEEKPGEKPED